MNTQPSRRSFAVALAILAIIFVALSIWTDSPLETNEIAAYPAPANTPSAKEPELAYPVESKPSKKGTPVPIESVSSIDAKSLTEQMYLPIAFNDWVLASKKKGLAWAFAGTYPNDYQPLHVRWYHDWGTTGPVDTQFMEFVPFISCDFGAQSPYEGRSAKQVNLIQQAVQDLGTNYDGYLLIFNEPNFFNASNPQCDKHPDEAAQIYVDIRNAFPNAKIVGPNLSEGGGYSAINYVELWRQEVFNLTGDYPDLAGYGVHIYRLNHNSALNFLNDFHQAMQTWGDGDKELWLTEFGFCNEWGPTHTDEFRSLVEDLESSAYDFVTRYAYYTTRQKDVIAPGDPTPTPASWEICNSDLYERYTFDLSIRGEVYQSVGLQNND
jgi:hypothetical protein